MATFASELKPRKRITFAETLFGPVLTKIHHFFCNLSHFAAFHSQKNQILKLEGRGKDAKTRMTMVAEMKVRRCDKHHDWPKTIDTKKGSSADYKRIPHDNN